MDTPPLQHNALRLAAALRDSQWRSRFIGGKCGYAGPFTLKKGMRFVTVFFVIPVLPISGVMHVAECQQCKTRYQAKVSQPGLQQTQGAR
jgi:hypothetical protein